MSAAVLVRNEEVIAQQVSQETVLFHMANGHYYALNDLASRIWELLDGKRNLRDISESIAIEYDAPAATIFCDVEELTKSFVKSGLLVEKSAG